jgi:hypothetical protein
MGDGPGSAGSAFDREPRKPAPSEQTSKETEDARLALGYVRALLGGLFVKQLNSSWADADVDKWLNRLWEHASEGLALPVLIGPIFGVYEIPELLLAGQTESPILWYADNTSVVNSTKTLRMRQVETVILGQVFKHKEWRIESVVDRDEDLRVVSAYAFPYKRLRKEVTGS